MWVTIQGVRGGGSSSGVRAGSQDDLETICEECNAAKNSLDCIDASIQVDLSEDEEDPVDNAMGRKGGREGESKTKKGMPMYSREDIREQYCINDKELQVFDNRRKKGLMGCFSDNGQAGISPCSRNRAGKKGSLLTSCIGRDGSDEELQEAAKGRPTSPGRQGNTWTGRGRGAGDEDDGFDENYFRRRPKSFCLQAEGRRYGAMDPGMRLSTTSLAEETYLRNIAMCYQSGMPMPPMMRPGSGMMMYNPYQQFLPMHMPGMVDQGQQMVRPPNLNISTDYADHQTQISVQGTQPNTPDLLIHRRTVNDSEVSLDDRKQKHVSFDSSSLMRSATLSAMTEEAVQKSVSSGQSSMSSSQTQGTPSKSHERLLDGRKSSDYAYYSELFTPDVARQIVLEKLKKASMRTQATQTDRGKQPPRIPSSVPYSPTTFQRAHMISESVQTNGLPVAPPAHLSAPQGPLHGGPLHGGPLHGGPHHGLPLLPGLPQSYHVHKGTSSIPHYTTLPHKRHQQYEVQVYNLDSPNGASTIPPTRYQGCQHSSSYQILSEHRGLSSSSTDASTRQSSSQCRDCSKGRSVSSDNILTDQESLPQSRGAGDYLSSAPRQYVDPPRHARLKKSMSEDGMIDGRMANYLRNNRVEFDGANDNGLSESELPELAPVKCSDQILGADGRDQGIDHKDVKVEGMGDKELHLVDEEDQELRASDQKEGGVSDKRDGAIMDLSSDDMISDQQGDNACDEPDIGQKLSPLGSTSSLRDLIECTSQEKENNNETWNDSQVTVISKNSPKSIEEKVSSPSLATTATTSMERTESVSSETLWREDVEISKPMGEMAKSSSGTSFTEVSPIENLVSVESRLEAAKEKTMMAHPELQSVPKIEKDFIGSNKRGNSQESDSSNGHSKKPKDLNICMSRTDSGTSAKTNETSTSDEYITAQEFSAQSSATSRNGSSLRSPKEMKVNGLSKVIHKLNKRDDEIQAVNVKPPCDLPPVPSDIEYNKPLISPPIMGEPKLKTGILGPCHVQIANGATDISQVHSDASQKPFQISSETCSLQSVGSGSVSSEGLGFVSPSLSTEIKSPLSETSSSSGSYSVTTESDAKKQEKDNDGSHVSVADCDSFRLSKGDGAKAEADIIFMEDVYDRQQEIMRQDDEKYQGSRPSSQDKENDSEIVEYTPSESQTIEQKKEQLATGTKDWSCEERSQRKQCMKLNLPGDIEVPKTGDADTENGSAWKMAETGNVKSKRSAFEQQINPDSPIKENVSTSKIQPHIKKNGKMPKTPSSIPREIAEEVFTPSQTLARSPAMHEGFRLKDWKVERTPINTPGTPDLHAARLPLLSDEEEEIGSESLDIGSETDPISKGSGTSSYLPSSMDVSDSRPTSSLPDKMVDVPETRPGISSPEKEELPPLVKPPAGFTDSPEKQKPIDIPGFHSEIASVMLAKDEVMLIEDATPIAEITDIVDKVEATQVLPEEKCHFSRKESYHHPELYVPKEQTTTVLREETVKMTPAKTTSRAKSKSRSRSRSKSGERLLHEIASQMVGPDNTDSTSDDEDAGIYTGEYQRQAWVFVGEVTNLPHKETGDSPREKLPLSRSASIESTQSEKEFTKKYQAITHRMVHRKSSAIMYSRILERTFECNKTVVVERVGGEFGFRIHGSRPVVVSAIEPDTPAASSGLVVGDILLTINGVNVLDLPHSQVVQVAQRGVDALTLGVARTSDSPSLEETVWDKLSGSLEVLAAGHLWKKKRSVVPGQQWTRRWFILRADHCLYSFKSENETKPSGAILLPGCSLEAEDDPDKEYCFQVIRPDHSSLWLAADDASTNQEWTEALARAATRRRSQSNIWLEVATERMNMGALDQPRPDSRGFLNQMSSCTRLWRRRYFILMDGCLYVYKEQEDLKATGVIFLHGYKTQSANFSGKRHGFEMIPTDPSLKHFYFHAQTETEKKRWLAALEYSIDRWMRLS